MFDECVEGLAVVGDVLGCSMYGWSEVVGGVSAVFLGRRSSVGGCWGGWISFFRWCSALDGGFSAMGGDRRSCSRRQRRLVFLRKRTHGNSECWHGKQMLCLGSCGECLLGVGDKKWCED